VPPCPQCQRVKRAHEEIERCHITIRRLYTAIHDEHDDFEKTLSRLRTSDSCVYGAVCDFTTRRRQVNDILLTRLSLLTTSSDYSGDCSRGVRAGSGRSMDGSGQPLVDDPRTPGNPNCDNDNDDEELGVDEADELVGQLVDYVSDLALLP